MEAIILCHHCGHWIDHADTAARVWAYGTCTLATAYSASGSDANYITTDNWENNDYGDSEDDTVSCPECETELSLGTLNPNNIFDSETRADNSDFDYFGAIDVEREIIVCSEEVYSPAQYAKLLDLLGRILKVIRPDLTPQGQLSLSRDITIRFFQEFSDIPLAAYTDELTGALITPEQDSILESVLKPGQGQVRSEDKRDIPIWRCPHCQEKNIYNEDEKLLDHETSAWPLPDPSRTRKKIPVLCGKCHRASDLKTIKPLENIC